MIVSTMARDDRRDGVSTQAGARQSRGSLTLSSWAVHRRDRHHESRKEQRPRKRGAEARMHASAPGVDSIATAAVATPSNYWTVIVPFIPMAR